MKFSTQLLFIFMVLTQFSLAQNISIEGFAPGAENMNAAIYITEDYITFREHQISESPIDQNGRFTLRCSINQTEALTLIIARRRFQFFAEPGKTYTIKLSAQTYNPQLLTPIYTNQPLTGTINSHQLPDINHDLNMFIQSYNHFIIQNRDMIIHGGKREQLRTFIKKVAGDFGYNTDPFFTHYIQYRLASLKIAGRITSSQTIVRELFADGNIQYNNPAYMELFRQIFDKYLMGVSHHVSTDRIAYMLYKSNSVNTILDTLGKDPLLINERLREFVLLYNIESMINTESTERKSSLNLIQQIQANSKFPQHRITAKNIYHRLTHLKPGSKAPDFTLFNASDDSLLLSSLKGSPLYLCFMNTTLSSCSTEIELMRNFYSKYPNIQLALVVVDQTKSDYQKFMATRQIPWPVYFVHPDQKTVALYEMVSLPLFILLDKDGNIIQYPALKPSEKIDRLFNRIR